MIRQHKSFKRSEGIVKSLVDRLNKDKFGIDGVYEVFKNENGDQGYMIKIFRTFSNDDLCIWTFESLIENQIYTIFGDKSLCDDFNNWISDDKLIVNKYPIKKDIKRDVVSDLENGILNHYEIERNFKI